MGAPPPPWRRHLNLRTLLGMAVCGIVWGVAMAPQRQPLEGALRVSALRFALRGAGREASGPLQGFLAVPLRRLTITGLADRAAGAPLVVQLRGQRLPLTGGGTLSLSARAADPLALKIALASGTRIEYQPQEGKGELVLDLLPPHPGGPSGTAAELTITPPSAEAAPGTGLAAAGLQAVFQEPGRRAQRIAAPEAEFPLSLPGAVRLRLQRVEAKSTMVFESNLSVKDVQFRSERSSVFDQSPISLSTLRSGTLHLGRQEPLTLRPDQFLHLDPPGIGVITSLRAEPGQLAVEVVGATARIRSGLSLQHPTTDLTGTLLSRHLSPDQITGFFGFLAGVISSLVVRLLQGD